MTYDPLDPEKDPFRPPEVPTEVACLHCGREYDSYLIEWRVQIGTGGKRHGFWCCPTPGCSGMGFGFDILPTDPNYCDERGGWICDDSEAEDADDGFVEDRFLDEEEFGNNGDFGDMLDAGRPPGPGSGDGNGEPGRPGPDEEIPF